MVLDDAACLPQTQSVVNVLDRGETASDAPLSVEFSVVTGAVPTGALSTLSTVHLKRL